MPKFRPKTAVRHRQGALADMVARTASLTERKFERFSSMDQQEKKRVLSTSTRAHLFGPLTQNLVMQMQCGGAAADPANGHEFAQRHQRSTIGQNSGNPHSTNIFQYQPQSNSCTTGTGTLWHGTETPQPQLDSMQESYPPGTPVQKRAGPGLSTDHSARNEPL